MQRGRKRLIYTVLLIIVILSIYFALAPFLDWFPFNRKEIFPSPPGDGKLDYEFIKNLTLNLSNITYPEGMLYKGRAFGSWGEQNASEILQRYLENKSYFNDYFDSITIENITNITELPLIGNGKLTTKLEVLAKRMIVHNHSDNTSHMVDCFISPRWNESYFDSAYNRNNLTHNFSYEDVKVVKMFDFNFDDFINYTLDEIGNDLYFYTNGQLLDLIKKLMEDYYDFTFENIDPENPETWPPFVQPVNISENFVFIRENPSFNPNYMKPWLNQLKLRALAFLVTSKTKLLIDYTSWKCHPNLVGIILFDYTNDSHDTARCLGIPFHKLFINGSEGKPIYKDPLNYTISFYLDQRYNKSIRSCNIIAQKNGTDSERTFIVCSLYDCMWTRGTADSAIGMSIVFGIAKYFADYNIKPWCNLQFIALCGEEYGGIGARHYEATHDEKINYVIDLNQLGFWQSYDVPLTLHVITNKGYLKDDLKEITDRTDYEKRINNTADFHIEVNPLGSVSNDAIFAINRPNCKTIMFLKDFGWVLHHRDGLNHSEGDVPKYMFPDDINATGEMVINVTYGLMFKKVIWEWEGFIPFIIAIVLIIIAIILIWKKKKPV